MSTEEIELTGIDYFYKFKERLDIAVAYISDGRDITEEDYAVLFEVFKIQESGNLPFHKTICNGTRLSVSQTNLFSPDSLVT